MPDPQAPQYIRDTVADFICPADSVANYQQGYRRHEAEEIRTGRGDDHELMRLVMGCVAELKESLKPFAAIPLCYPREGSKPQRSELDVPAPGGAYTALDVERARKLLP